MATQDQWRRCTKCEGLVFAGQGGTGPCPAGGQHAHDADDNYILRLSAAGPVAGMQDGWRHCKKCSGLAFTGAGAGKCPAGGAHEHTGSGAYSLATAGLAGAANEQDGWRWCKKCQGLASTAGGALGACPAGGKHDHSGSGNYGLLRSLLLARFGDGVAQGFDVRELFKEFEKTAGAPFVSGAQDPAPIKIGEGGGGNRPAMVLTPELLKGMIDALQAANQAQDLRVVALEQKVAALEQKLAAVDPRIVALENHSHTYTAGLDFKNVGIHGHPAFDVDEKTASLIHRCLSYSSEWQTSKPRP